MKKIVCAVLLLILAGCAIPMSPKATNLILPVTDEVVITACYYTRLTVLSGTIPAKKEDFLEPGLNNRENLICKNLRNLLVRRFFFYEHRQKRNMDAGYKSGYFC